MSSNGIKIEEMDNNKKKFEFTVNSKEKLGELFKQLDSNGDGRIDVHDLSDGLKKLNIPQIPGSAQVII